MTARRAYTIRSHVLTGSLGHTGFIPYSAFDPSFYAPSNVDLLMAIFQAMNPKLLRGKEELETSHQRLRHIHRTAHHSRGHLRALRPLPKDAFANSYTSTTAQSTRSFGYMYPEAVGWAEQLASTTHTAFNKLTKANNNPTTPLLPLPSPLPKPTIPRKRS